MAVHISNMLLYRLNTALSESLNRDSHFTELVEKETINECERRLSEWQSD